MFRDALRSLRHRNYRIFFLGQGVSLTGAWMQHTAQAWLVYRLTDSAWMLGLAGFAGQIPVLLFGLAGGHFADRHERRGILVWTQALSMAHALAMAALASWEGVQVWHVIALSGVLGLVTAFDMPARQAFLSDTVEKEDLANAIALNSSMVNGTRIIGPAVAGVLIASAGEAPCFLINALSYLPVLAGLLVMRLPAAPEREQDPGMLESLRRGLAYLGSRPDMGAALTLLGCVCLAGLPVIMALMPVFSEEVLREGPKGLGWLMSAVGVGAIGGALILAFRNSVAGLDALAGASAAGFGAALLALAACRTMPAALAACAFAGLAMMACFAGVNTLLQTRTEEGMRGRVMSIFSMTFLGVAPVGSLLAGWLAERWGAPAASAAGGLACLAAGAWQWRRARLHN